MRLPFCVMDKKLTFATPRVLIRRRQYSCMKVGPAACACMAGRGGRLASWLQMVQTTAAVARHLGLVARALAVADNTHHRPAAAPCAAAAAAEGDAPDGASPSVADYRFLADEPVLSPRDLELWQERGYMVLKGAAAKEDCAAVVEQMCAAMGMSATEPETWHRRGGPGDLTEAGEVRWEPEKETPIHHAVPMKNTQAQWNIRTSPRIYTAFAQIYGTAKLWCMPNGVVTLKPPWRSDRARFTHICHAGHKPWFGLGDALPMHFDVSADQLVDGGYICAGGTFDAVPEPGFPFATCRYRPPGCIGFLMLNDRSELGGQTSVVPRLHRYLDQWVNSQAAQAEIERMRRPESRQHPEMTHTLRSIDEVFKEPDGRGAEIIVPAGKAGDLVIVDSWLIHGSGKNTMDTPRFTMWVTSSPVPSNPVDREEQRAQRVSAFNRQGGWKPLDERGRLPALTPLGERLVGVQAWGDT